MTSLPLLEPLRRTRGFSQTLVLALGFVVLIAISAASIWLVNRAKEDAAQVSHTLRVENTLSQVQIMVRRAESAQRGYLLTGDASYLEFFEETLSQVVPTLLQARASTADNADRQNALSTLEPDISQKLAELRQTVEMYKAGDAKGALQIVRTDRGEALMRDITSQIERMKDQEERLLAQRTTSSNQTSLWLLLVNLVGVVTIIGLAGLSMHLVQRNTAALREAHKDVANANQSLERRVLERTANLQEANNEIQSFAYIVSHDLRSPLVNIMGFTSELEALRTDLFDRLADLRQKANDTNTERDAELGRDFEEAFGFIKASITKMDRLIKAILDLSRQGRAEFHPVPVEVAPLVQNIGATMAHQLLERDATLKVGPLPSIVSDRLALEQIFTNLIDNAVKYLRVDVPGRIEISATETPGYVTYLVSDNGRGIDPRDKVRVFELFRRSGPQDRPGEGIGLAHVRTLVRRMGGAIIMDSELGRGTTFKVTLPRRLVLSAEEEKHD
ncbi:sensor histidine kinase [Roseixanthobacter pseudopolyaromaticivorans]|uniref:sensor histidine kinase n=1 Tax=Xanthobacteraceae TaxID=335928 RepID=UPI0037276D3E